MYLNNFTDRESMIRDFGIDPSVLDGCFILLASYGSENYCGDAYVLYEKDGELYEVHGSHCSCYGLSESSYDGSTTSQWSPERTTLESVIYRVSEGNLGNDDYAGNVFKTELLMVLDMLKNGVPSEQIDAIVRL